MSTDHTDEIDAGASVVIEDRGCKLCRTGIDMLVGQAALVEGPDQFWTNVHQVSFPRHRVFRLRFANHATAPACEFMLRRIPPSASQ